MTEHSRGYDAIALSYTQYDTMSDRFKSLYVWAATLVFALLMFAPGFVKADNHTPYKILVYGDSLMAGYGLDQGQAVPDKLAVMLNQTGYKTVEVINASTSGETTTGGLNRMEWTLKHNPDMVILALGANDALRFIDPKITYNNLSKMIHAMQQRDITVLLAGMLAPRNAGAEFTASFDQIYPTLAQRHNVPLYPFILKDVAMVPQLNLRDGVHPNDGGTDIMARNLLPYVTGVLKNEGIVPQK